MRQDLDSRALTERVSIRARAAGVDAAGQPSGAWTELVQVWGNILNLNGFESIKADQDVAIARASIRIRDRGDITPAMRAVHLRAGTVVVATYEIKAVLPVQGRRALDLVCEVVYGS